MVHAEERLRIYELSIARLWPYDTLPARKVTCVFSSVGENINTTLFIIIFIVLGCYRLG